MNSKSAALRLHVESALAGRVVAPFQHRAPQIVETVPIGILQLDVLTGGLLRGGLTEVFGPAGSGKMSLLTSVLALRTAAMEACALVDGRDAFDPYSAEMAGVNLKQLLWVRCRDINQTLRTTDLLIQGGGFGLIVLDLSDIPARIVRHVPLNVWFRFRRAIENTPTILMLLAQQSNAKTCVSLVLRLGRDATCWINTCGNEEEWMGLNPTARLLEDRKSRAEMVRSPMQRSKGISSERVTTIDVPGYIAHFETTVVQDHSQVLRNAVKVERKYRKK